MRQDEAEENRDNLAATAEEPNACPTCGRPAAAARPQCLYCGTVLRHSDLPTTNSTSLAGPGLDLSELGYTVFATGGSVGDAAALLASLDAEVLTTLLSGPYLPVARTARLSEAKSLANALTSNGVECSVVADEQFCLARPNTRISAIDIAASAVGFTDFNTRARVEIAPSDLKLIVEGMISRSRIDSISKGRGRTSKTVSETVAAEHEPVLDLYTSSTLIGFRIVPSGFDFSVLGERKHLTAAENWQTLIEMLRARFPDARTDREYDRLRRPLGAAWPPESQAFATGRVISGFGRRDFGSVASVSNQKQFDMYSRSRRYFYESPK